MIIIAKCLIKSISNLKYILYLFIFYLFDRTWLEIVWRSARMINTRDNIFSGYLLIENY